MDLSWPLEHLHSCAYPHIDIHKTHVIKNRKKSSEGKGLHPAFFGTGHIGIRNSGSVMWRKTFVNVWASGFALQSKAWMGIFSAFPLS